MQATSRHETLQASIEATADAFLSLVTTLPDSGWLQRAPGSKWTGKQLLHHITWALEQLPKEVESARRGKGMFNAPRPISDTGSYWLAKWGARTQTRESLLHRYASASERALEALHRVDDADWNKGARFYGEGFYSIADLFSTPANHFQEHAAVLAGTQAHERP